MLRRTAYAHMTETQWAETRARLAAHGGPIRVSMTPQELHSAAEGETLYRNHNGKRWRINPNADQAMTVREGRPFKNVAQGGTGADKRGKQQATPYKGEGKTPKRETPPVQFTRNARPREASPEAGQQSAMRSAFQRVTQQQRRERGVAQRTSEHRRRVAQRDEAVQRVKQQQHAVQREERNARWRAERAEARLRADHDVLRAIAREKKNVARRVPSKSREKQLKQIEADATKASLRLSARKAALKQARQEEHDAQRRKKALQREEAKAKRSYYDEGK